MKPPAWQRYWAFHRQHNGFVMLQRYYERHFTPVGKSLLLLYLISLSLGMVGTEVLIYIFCCALGGLWVATLGTGWLARPRATQLQVVRPEWLQAGRPARIQTRVRLQGRRPLFHLRSELVLQRAGEWSQRVVSPEEWFCLQPEQEARLELSWTPPARGAYRLRETSVMSAFPLGLALWRQRHLENQDWWVLPALFPVTERPWLQFPATPLQGRGLRASAHSESLEFHGLRPWLPGDSPRQIHWAALARSGQLTVREYQESTGHRVVLLVCPEADDLYAEAAISFGASLLLAMQQEPQHSLAALQLGSETHWGEGLHSRQTLLLAFARMQAAPPPQAEPWQTLLLSQPTLLLGVASSWTPAWEAVLEHCQRLRLSVCVYLLSATRPAHLPPSVVCLDPRNWGAA
ncbi:MAG: DUF58 domain-containing protein [Candidatus Sericytochromatia bacterium]